MDFDIRPARAHAAAIDPAVVAAIAVALASVREAAEDVTAPQPARSPWRAAGRSIEAFDAYEAARHDRGVRRGNAR